jgi:tRNA/tmRNA/rRNA uracil-C5-methylase (TrmA/RlmC/RlmD family)
MGEWRGREVELDVTNIAHGGITVARLDGRVVFVADAIPGEHVKARITEDAKKSFWRADAIEVLEASPHRQPHIWPEASIDRDPVDRAGGAEFGHIALAHQRELKRQVLTDALSRMAGIDSDVTVEAADGDDETHGTGWRTRVRLHVDESGLPGPFAARSHRVVPVAALPLATAGINEVAPLRDEFAAGTTIDVIEPRGAHGARLVVGAQRPATITEIVGDREFRLLETGFWQVHVSAAEVLSRAVREAIMAEHFDPRADNLDLYGGVGLLAAAVADQFGPTTRITSVESDETATEFAGHNLAEWTGARAVTGRVEQWLRGVPATSRTAAGTILLDPPRSGAGAAVLDELDRLDPAQIVYVACDPVAFARDTKTLLDKGFSLAALRAFDLFPNTHHLEAVGTFVRG